MARWILAKAYALVCLRLAATKNQDGYSWHPEPRDAQEGSLASQTVTSYYHQPLDHALITQKADGTALAVSFLRGLRTHEQQRRLEGTLAEVRLQFLFE